MIYLFFYIKNICVQFNPDCIKRLLTLSNRRGSFVENENYLKCKSIFYSERDLRNVYKRISKSYDKDFCLYWVQT